MAARSICWARRTPWSLLKSVISQHNVLGPARATDRQPHIYLLTHLIHNVLLELLAHLHVPVLHVEPHQREEPIPRHPHEDGHDDGDAAARGRPRPLLSWPTCTLGSLSGGLLRQHRSEDGWATRYMAAFVMRGRRGRGRACGAGAAIVWLAAICRLAAKAWFSRSSCMTSPSSTAAVTVRVATRCGDDHCH